MTPTTASDAGVAAAPDSPAAPATGDAGVPGGLDAVAALADGVLLPCFDGTAAPAWVLRRVAGTLAGVCLFARNVGDRAALRGLTDALRAARPDVVIAIDEEAGDVTRMDAAEGSRFPGNAALGRADDVDGTREIGRQVGDLLADAGITLNLAPCADVALDARNPVIGTRSFGSDPGLVARHTAAFVAGQQGAGVAACAKHFPGHGDTAVDTHSAVAVLDRSLAELAAADLQPFRAAIGCGVAAVMSGHLVVPSVDDRPATVSHRWLTDILRGDMGFDGVVVTDALEMAAIAGMYGVAEGAVMALAAGADLLCLGGEDAGEWMLDEVRDAIVDAVMSGRLPADRLRDAARRVATLGGRTGAAVDGAGERPAPDPAVAGRVAAAALQVAGPIPPLREPVLVVRCEEFSNIAVGSIPWSPAETVPEEFVPDSSAPAARPRELVLRRGDPLPLTEIDRAATVLLATRDRHRHDWMGAVLAGVRARRADAVLLEMGGSGAGPADAPAIATFGATRANARAALHVLRGPVPTE